MSNIDRVFNFSAGPSTLPLPCLEDAAKDIINYSDCGCGIMELSHRSRPYKEVIDHTEKALRELMNIPEEYAVLFLQGGATEQFSMSAMNFAKHGEKAGYAVTGVFAKKAFAEAEKWVDAIKVTDSSDINYSAIPEIKPEMLTDDMRYLHITGNNTAAGTEYRKTPFHGNIPLIGDWTSGILGSEINVKDYALIYAGAQKNLGIAGLAVAIVDRNALIDDIESIVPSMMQYKKMDESGSMLNTPATFAIYFCGKMLDWIASQGGVSEIEKVNIKKSDILYEIIDSSKLYKGLAEKESRSIMNVTFTLPTEELTADFLEMTEKRGMIGLKGYRFFGGVRASMYNAMPLEGAEKLAQCMIDFEKGYRE